MKHPTHTIENYRYLWFKETPEDFLAKWNTILGRLFFGALFLWLIVENIVYFCRLKGWIS